MGETRSRTAALRRARTFRLSRSVRPAAVTAHFEIDPTGSRGFRGHVEMDLDLTRGSRTVELHAADLRIERASATCAESEWQAEIEHDVDRETVRLRFENALPRGRCRVELGFKGTLRDDLTGLYRVRSGSRTFAFTQLCTTSARRLFPCFDEPDFKTRFSLSATVPESCVAISNMPIAQIEPDGPGQQRIRFEQTPPLSTYVLALAVGEFEFSRTAHCGRIPIRVVTTPGKTGLADFALDAAAACLVRLERWFGIEYPYPKLDLVAAPSFEFGAMENAGAVFFLESLMLADPDATSLTEKKRITEVICHELAHMWFGDLVTMGWWDDLWLNEAFATWMAFAIVDAWKPEWHMWQMFQHRKAAALDLDGLRNTHAVYAPVRSADEAQENFDLITYEKGAAIIRMLEAYLGADAFRAGVRLYLERHAEGNAVAADLWNALEATSEVPVERIVRAWIETPGHPHVSVHGAPAGGGGDGAEIARIELRQSLAAPRTTSPATPPAAAIANAKENANSDAQVNAPAKNDPRWPIPWQGRLLADASETHRTRQTLLDTPTASIDLTGAGVRAVYVNAGETGFYRPHHDAPLLAALIERVALLSPLERQGFVDHQWALARAGEAPIASVLDLVCALAGDTDPDVLEATTVPLREIAAGLVHDLAPECIEAFRRWVREAFREQAHEIARLLGEPEAGPRDTRRPSDTHTENDSTLRAHLLSLVGGLGRDARLIARAREVAPSLLAGVRVDDPDLVGTWLALAASEGDAALYDTFDDVRRNGPTPQIRQRALVAWASFEAPEFIARTLESCARGRVAKQDVVIVLGRLLALPTGQAQSWAFITEHWERLSKQIPQLHGGRLILATPALRTLAYHREVKRFFRANPLPASRRALAQATERFEGHARLRKHAGAELERILLGAREGTG